MIAENIEVREREELFINLNPLQVAGRLTPEAAKALIAYGDGYSVCDWCKKPFRLDKICKPPIAQFTEELAEFVNMEDARVLPGARRCFQAVMSSVAKKGDTVIVSSLGHYTMYLAVEGVGASVAEVPADANVVKADAVAKKVEEVKKRTGKLPALIAISHFDYQYGNEHEAKKIGKVAKDYGVPFLYNGAYTVGVMPVDGKKMNADFVVGSGHKSMASPAPTGVLATSEEMAKKVFRTTQIEGDLTGRKFGVKEVELLGCTVMGAPIVAMMASFSTVKERVKEWDEHVKLARWFVGEMEKIEGTECLSETPRKHCFTKLKTEGFGEVGKTHKRRGFFLYDALKKRGITGIFPGASRSLKLSTYGCDKHQVEYLARAFQDIAAENKLRVE